MGERMTGRSAANIRYAPTAAKIMAESPGTNQTPPRATEVRMKL